MEIRVTEVLGDGSKTEVILSSGERVRLYRSELRQLAPSEREALLGEGNCIPGQLYDKVMDIIGARAKRRVLHLLERMDRTERQLGEKLRQGGYPEECIEGAIAYARELGYVDDLRYAKSYVRCHQDEKSRARLLYDLSRRGVPDAAARIAMEEEYSANEQEMIRELLSKRHFCYEESDERERMRTVRFLRGRGYRDGDIMRAMKGGGRLASGE